jgi:hypothetical protein
MLGSSIILAPTRIYFLHLFVSAKIHYQAGSIITAALLRVKSELPVQSAIRNNAVLYFIKLFLWSFSVC